ncbi:ferrochelatase [Sphingomonas sp. Leaf24]|uniref:ferrochelatase n=1 Tax=unclassified Sphingomonas TaxID=196159 RepID=UPI0006F661F9|nr:MULTISPECIES: ferrochelatase [unclassified Sphingomonas]KQM20033.1 ferrochelatase [Sphingomonas sp. Leaf5]KQM88924.1 ferrochelatase [Sphingomonas sp. Leaf22]KQM90811.1 ferrochelatase [Sphingomonas sp. Leaf24]
MDLPSNHPAIPQRRVGVLLMNLGTPDDPSPRSVKRYLAEFLSDRRVVEIPPIAWQPILRGIILNTRPKKSAHAYQQVWSERGSPLAAITRAQSDAMQGAFGDGVVIDWAMRYGNPSIASRIDALRQQGCDRVLLAPLYPQYCAATTATANDKAFAHLATLRWQPAIRTLPPYYDDPLYIDALATTLREDLAKLAFEPDAIVASFHGMPKRTLALGDPYHCHCQKTARLVSEALDRPLTIAFQSRFGPAKWLGPATDETLVELAKAGKRRVAIFAPGFSADCLETLEELAIRGRESFETAGGTDFAYLPCLNAEPTGNKMLRNIIARELAGWVDPA